MKRFLALCEQYDPTFQDSPTQKLLTFLRSKGIKVSQIKGTDTLYIDDGTETFVVNVDSNSEDAENLDSGYGDFSVSNEVENLAGKAENGLKGLAGKVFGTAAQQAKGAIQQRQKVSQQAVGAYRKATQRLQKDISNVK